MEGREKKDQIIICYERNVESENINEEKSQISHE